MKKVLFGLSLIISNFVYATSTSTSINSTSYISIPENAGGGFTVTPFQPAQCIFSSSLPAITVTGHRIVQGETWAINSTGVSLWCKNDTTVTGNNFITTTIAADASINGSGSTGGGGGGGNVNITQVGGATFALGQSTMSGSLPVTIASNQSNLNVNCVSGCSGGGGTSDVVATGSIAALNATVTTGELNGASTLGIEFNGLSASASGNVTVQVSTDGTVWREVGLLQGIDGGLPFSPGVGNFPAAENLHLLTSVTGAKFARVIFDTYISGSATVTLRASSGSQPFNVGLLHTLINVQNDLDNILSSGLPYSPGTATSNNQTNGSQLTQIVDSFNDPAQLISDGAGNYNLGVIVVVKTTTSSASGTITTGGTAQTALAANANRHSLTIYNNDAAETLYFNLTGTASLTLQGSIGITAGGAYSCECTDAVSVIATTTAHKFTIWSR